MPRSIESDLRNAINDEWRNKDKARNPRFVRDSTGVGADDNGLQYSPALFPTGVAGLVSRYSGEAGTYNYDFYAGIPPLCSFQNPCYVNNDAVLGWKDLSGNNLHLNKMVSPVHNGVFIPPVLSVDSQQGLPGITFSGNNLSVSSITLSQPFTVFIVQKLSTLAANNAIFGGGGNSTGLIFNFASGTYAMGVTAFRTGLIVADTNVHVITCIFNGASSFLAVDRNSDTLSGNPGAGSFNPFVVSSTKVTNGIAGNQTVYEVALYSTAVSSSDQTTLLNYFSGKWGLGI